MSHMPWRHWKIMSLNPSDAYIEGGWSGFSGGFSLAVVFFVQWWPLRVAAFFYWLGVFIFHCRRQGELAAKYNESMESIGKAILDAEKGQGK